MDEETPGEDPRPLPEGCWVRSNQGLEFNRVVFFTDAVFAIALTLLIFSVTVPILRGNTSDPQTMLDALSDKEPEFVGFFVAFILIARYWMAHHVFLSHLRAVDRRFVGINLVYLAFVAFLPFPTALLVKYEENPLSVLTFALCLAVISGLEIIQFHRAHRLDLFTEAVPHEVYRYWMVGSVVPIVVFAVASPLAWVSCNLCLASWLVIMPIEKYLERRAPEDTSRYLARYRPKRNA